jgi:hypothetical protein
VKALGVVELQGAGERIEDAVGGAAQVAALESHVVLDAHAGEHGDLFATKAGDAPLLASEPYVMQDVRHRHRRCRAGRHAAGAGPGAAELVASLHEDKCE